MAKHADPLLRHIEANRQRISNLKGLGSADKKFLATAVQELTDSLDEALAIQEYLRAEREQSTFKHEELLEERQHYYELFELAPYSYLITSRSGQIQEANKASALLLNMEKAFLVGLPLRVFLHKDEQASFDDLLARFRHETTPQQMCLRFQPRKKDAFTAAVTINFLQYGEDVGFSWTVQDPFVGTPKGEKLAPALCLESPQEEASLSTPFKKERCFEMWLLGKLLDEIRDFGDVRPDQALEWVRDWERGVQQKWQPQIFG